MVKGKQQGAEDDRYKLTIRMPRELVRSAKIRAAELEVDLQDVVTMAVREFCSKKGGR